MLVIKNTWKKDFMIKFILYGKSKVIKLGLPHTRMSCKFAQQANFAAYLFIVLTMNKFHNFTWELL